KLERGRLDLAGLKALHRFRRDQGLRGQAVTRLHGTQLGPGARCPLAVEVEVARDPEQPRAARPRLPQRRPRAEGALVGGLDQVVGVGGVAREAGREGGQLLQVTEGQRRELLTRQGDGTPSIKWTEPTAGEFPSCCKQFVDWLFPGSSQRRHTRSAKLPASASARPRR